MKFTEKYVKRFVAVVVMTVLVSGTVLFSVAEDGAGTGAEASAEEHVTAGTSAETEALNAGSTEAAPVVEVTEPEEAEPEELEAEPEEPAEELETEPAEELETEPEEAEPEPEESAGSEETDTGSEDTKDKEKAGSAEKKDTDKKNSDKKNSDKKDTAKKEETTAGSESSEDGETDEAAGSAYVIPRNNRQRKYQMKEDNVVLTGDYNQDGMEDLFVIQQSDTKSDKVEVHILSGESNYYSYIDVIKLDLDMEAEWTFLLADYDPGRAEDPEGETEESAGAVDLYAISSDTEKTMLYVFDGATDYEEVLLEEEIPVPDADDQELTFLAGDADGDQVTDLYIIDSGNTGSGYVEVTVLDGTAAYQEVLMEAVTAFELPDAAGDDEAAETEMQLDFGLADYDEDGHLDLYIIQKAGTKSGKTEVSILAAEMNEDVAADIEAELEDTEDEAADAGMYELFLEECKETHLDLPEQEAKFIVPEEAVNIQVFYTGETKSGCVEGYLMAYRGAATISEGAYLEALRYEGMPYVWGGESLINGVDCSGLVKVIYEKFDVHMAHSSLLMRYAGMSVDKSDLQVGDLLCYDGHIGFYAGDGKLYSALGTKYGIRYNSAYYKPILTIRRIK